MNILSDISNLKFLKPEEITNLKRLINADRIIDFLLYIPSYYKVFEAKEFTSDTVQKGQEVKFNNCKIIQIANQNLRYRKVFTVKIQNSNFEEIWLNFFKINDSFKIKFKVDGLVNISGKLDFYKDKKIISHPKVQFINENENFNQIANENLEKIIPIQDNEKHPNKNIQNSIIKIVYPRENLNEDEEEEESPLFTKNKPKKAKITNFQNIIGIESFYQLTEGIGNFFIKKVLKRIFIEIKKHHNYKDFMSFNIKEYENLPSFFESLEKIHFPENINDISSDSIFFKRLAIDEIFANQMMINLARKEERNLGLKIEGNNSLKELAIKNLPFELTPEQIEVLNEIYQDQQKEEKMFRLLQGDVGSGKTIVAILAALNTVEAGFKVAILAPTSILANQHYNTILQIAKSVNISCELLTGNTTQKSRKDLSSMIRLGFVDILIGTHALLYSDMDFSKFGLFIIDEQHNFGVEQRNALNKKNETADILMMSATPIPRTLLMSYYGDIKISTINSKPKNRKKIDTKIMSIEKYDNLIISIKNAVNKGEKIYWVCPLIEESSKLNYQNVISRFETICQEIPKDKIGIIHGSMQETEKDKVMKDFLESKFKVLVCTTVIEVGVNVPDATIIVIENANKFGLAQLHQLRGRVGRSDLQSYCILLYDKKLSEKGKKRLEILKESGDGFYIAQQDLKMRGGGNILGKQQSGFNIFKIANFFSEKDYIYKISLLTKEIANKILQNNIKEENLKEIDKIKILKQIFCNFQLEEYING